MILEKIISDRKKAVEDLKQQISIKELEKKITEGCYKPESFKKALQDTRMPVNIIAEIKKASPSKGLICREFPYVEIARAYEKGGAAAISVLTEPEYFQGCNDYLSAVKEAVSLPVLRKDFIIDPFQIYEAKAIGADAILLIAAALETKELTSYLKTAKELGMDCLVETHNQQEVETALEAGAEVIGVNNRDLKTFEVNFGQSEKLRKFIPEEKVFVAESGIHTEEDVRRLKQIGANAILIGESLVKAVNPEQQLQKFIFS